MAEPFEKLQKANKDYYKAVNKIFRDNDFIADANLRTEVKAKFGAAVNTIFKKMKQADEIIAQYYGVK